MSEKGGDDFSSPRSLSDTPLDDESVGGKCFYLEGAFLILSPLTVGRASSYCLAPMPLSSSRDSAKMSKLALSLRVQGAMKVVAGDLYTFLFYWLVASLCSDFGVIQISPVDLALWLFSYQGRAWQGDTLHTCLW